MAPPSSVCDGFILGSQRGDGLIWHKALYHCAMSNAPKHWADTPNAPPAGTHLGDLADLPDGQARMFLWRSADPQAPAFPYLLLRSGAAVRAYVNRCGHFGIPLAQKQEQLLFQPHTSLTCNVHYARYDWNDGRCVGGDCEGEGLLALPIVVDAQGAIILSPP